MQNAVRYYIVKADDRPVVRSVPVSRPHVDASAARNTVVTTATEPRKPSVSSLLRHALRRNDSSRDATVE